VAKKSAPKKTKSGKLPTPTGPHTPISNVAIESMAPASALRAEPQVPAGAKLRKTTGGAENLGTADALESAAVPVEAHFRRLLDIGRASFREPDVKLETVHGPDNRIRITNGDPAKYPWSLNASLLITAHDGSQWIGTGWFISPRTLITAGHCVYITNSGVPGRDGWVKSIQVMPGRDETNLPFGSKTSMHFFSVKGWADSGDENYDYAAVILPTPFAKDPGTIGFAVNTDAQLQSMVANVAGYPGDKDSGTLWYDKKKIASTTPTKVFYDIDTAGGQSGAAVYQIDGGGARIAVAVHAYGGAVTNSGTRISAPVFTNMKNWSL
jgi:glutamyl endopeptidase